MRQAWGAGWGEVGAEAGEANFPDGVNSTCQGPQVRQNLDSLVVSG